MKRGAGFVLFLAVVLSSAPSVPSVPKVLPAVPSSAELEQLETFSRWVAGESTFRAIAAADRDRALASAEPAVTLFDGRPLGDASRRLLAGLPYGSAIEKAAERHRVDGLLLAAVVEVESSFDPRSLSHRGAMGLMQIMPDLADGAADPFDPSTNLELGARYFGSLLRRFDGDVELALAAYNAGPGAVQRFGGVPPYRETSRFVSRVMDLYADHSRGVAHVTLTRSGAARPILATR